MTDTAQQSHLQLRLTTWLGVGVPVWRSAAPVVSDEVCGEHNSALEEQQ